MATNKLKEINQDAKQALSSGPQNVLIVDDDPLIRLGLEKLLTKEGFKATAVGTSKKALERIEKEAFFLVLLDLKLPDSFDGLALLEIIKKTRPETTVIMISGQTEIRGAVEAMKLGARDYLEKPIDFNRLKEILESLRPESPTFRKSSSLIVDDLIFVSENMKKVVDLMQHLALKSDITILLLGESGTGKNFICQKIHELSPRKDFPYVQIGCSNIPENLIESELFGYEKGAFTDAKNSKKGLVEMAEGGTLLLDELGEMPYPFQAKVLGLLEEKRFRKIGALQDTSVDVRIMAATNKDLHKLVQEKSFRLDLYYRLNMATIKLPSLRERKEDIPLLVDTFLSGFCKKYNAKTKTIDKHGINLLQQYPWPGNIRQLKNLMEKLVVLSTSAKVSSDEISSNLLLQQPMETETADKTVDLDSYSGLSLDAMEEKYIRTALKLTGGNQRKAAQLLNIRRDALRYRLKKLGISAKEDDD